MPTTLKKPRRNFMADLMAEEILYGGAVATRAEVYADVLARIGSAKIADMYAFGRNAKALGPDDPRPSLTLAMIREIESRHADKLG